MSNSNNTCRETPEGFRDGAIEDFVTLAFNKYNKGQEEHGGYLPDRASFQDLEEEIIDLWFYVRAMRHRVIGKIKSYE